MFLHSTATIQVLSGGVCTAHASHCCGGMWKPDGQTRNGSSSQTLCYCCHDLYKKPLIHNTALLVLLPISKTSPRSFTHLLSFSPFHSFLPFCCADIARRQLTCKHLCTEPMSLDTSREWVETSFLKTWLGACELSPIILKKLFPKVKVQSKCIMHPKWSMFKFH